MLGKKLLSVIILNWNGGHLLRKFLPSVVLAAQDDRVEVIVADNGSTDSSLEVLDRYFPAVRVIRLDRNYGFAEGYNRAIAEVQTEYVVLLNSDVETPCGWWLPILDFMQANPGVGACQPKIMSYADKEMFEYAGAAGGLLDKLGYPYCRGRLFDRIEKDCGQYDSAPADVAWASGAALMVCRDAYLQVGGLDNRFFAHMEEIDLCWRLRLRGWSLRIVPQSTVYHQGAATLRENSPLKIYLNHRNNLQMLFKCASPAQRVFVAIVRPSLDFAAALSYLVQGHWRAFCAVGRAWRDFLRNHGSLRLKRRAVRAEAKNAPVGIYRGSILLRYFFGCRTFSRLMK